MPKKYTLDPLPGRLAKLAREAKKGDQLAACELATLGSSAAVTALIEALAQPSWQVRSDVLSGIRSAFRGKRATVEFSDSLGDAIAEVLKHSFRRQKKKDQPQQSEFASQTAIEILPLLNRERTILHLTHPNVLRLNNPDLPLVLRALNDLGHPLKMDLVPWIEEIQPLALADSYIDNSLCSEILCNMALQHHPSVPLWIEEVEKNFPYYGEAQIGAAKARCYHLDLPPNFHWKILDLSYPKDGRVRLPKVVQHFVRAIEMMTWSNLGFEQYLEHEGDEVANDIEVLTAIGDEVQVWRLRKCVELFGPAGVPGTFEERVERIHADDGHIWDAIIDLGFPEDVKSPELQVLYFQFAAKHAEEFRRFLAEHV
ncbi:hypothetical protein [Verrucomicrobium sp. BvORR106]|uniref:hypothetical protein n=1 Tax=Verrucomicrobium sp. BvORR106 TaxID=1403819 RepID=UPI0005716406|nr:hypothetical protein [Verrucomicrobium sp. BvORR106]